MMILLLLGAAGYAAAVSVDQQKAALLSAKAAWGENHPAFRTWDEENAQPCHSALGGTPWRGIVCDDDGHVVALLLTLHVKTLLFI